MKARRIVWSMVFGLLALAGQAAAAGLGVGRGIDHVGLLVRPENFDSAVAVLRDQLGFSATPALLSPVGAENHLIWFRDLSYLEVDTFTERNDSTAPFLDFLAEHEGAKFYGTEVLHAAQAVSFLTAAGYPNVGPLPAGPLTIVPSGQVVGLTPLWNSIILTSRVAPDNSNFFLDYDEAAVRQLFVDHPELAPKPHPNTAQRLASLWLVVSDLDAAIDFYRGLGLEVRSMRHRIPYLGARGAVVRFHHQKLRLLVPDGPGLVADFVADRGEGVMGVSLEVGDLHTAHALIRHNTGLDLRTFDYRGRDRFLIPPSLTHGLTIEMVE